MSRLLGCWNRRAAIPAAGRCLDLTSTSNSVQRPSLCFCGRQNGIPGAHWGGLYSDGRAAEQSLGKSHVIRIAISSQNAKSKIAYRAGTLPLYHYYSIGLVQFC
jgi:hypothetical protein